MLTDVVMPLMSGKECFELLKERNPDLKVIYMSGYTENIIAQRGVLKEGTNFIQKPFLAEDLAQTLRQVLDS